jgi:DNA-binding NarL/FixJ family response regulator
MTTRVSHLWPLDRRIFRSSIPFSQWGRVWLHTPDGPWRSELTTRLRALVAVDNDETLAIVEGICRPACELVESVKDGWAMIRAAEQLSPDLVIADLDMPLLDGIEAAARLLSSGSATCVVILASESAREFVEEAFEAGASAYVLKADADLELLLAIRTVLDGRRFTSRSCGG